MMATVRKYEKGKMTLKQQLSLKLKGEEIIRWIPRQACYISQSQSLKSQQHNVSVLFTD